MTSIIISRRHYTQPQGRVVLSSEWENAETAWIGANPLKNLGYGPDFAPQGDPRIYITEGGVGMASAAYTQQGWVANRSANPANENWPGVTLVLEVYFTSLSVGAPGLLTFAPEGELHGAWNLTAENTGSLRFFFVRFGNSAAGMSLTGTNWGSGPAASEWEVGDRWRLVYVYSRNGTVRLHGRKNGEAKILNVRTGASTAWRSATALNTIGGHSRSGFRASTYPITCAAVFPYPMEDAAADALLDNPWQLFRADPLRIYSFPAGPITITGITASDITSSSARITLGVTR